MHVLLSSSLRTEISMVASEDKRASRAASRASRTSKFSTPIDKIRRQSRLPRIGLGLGSLTSRWMSRCRALARVQRQRAYAGTSRPQIAPVARPRFDKRTVLEVLKDRGAAAQQEIMQDGSASEPAEQLQVDLAAAVAMAARRATTKASRPAAKRGREARPAPSALAKRRAKRARKEVRWASGYTIPARPRADEADGEAAADA